MCYNKKTLIKDYSIPRDFAWFENHKLIFLAFRSINFFNFVGAFLCLCFVIQFLKRDKIKELFDSENLHKKNDKCLYIYIDRQTGRQAGRQADRGR